MPSMIAVFDCPRALVDLTISGFMLCFALSMLVWGPLSDKYGRKPVLAAGLGVYAAASLVCLFSVSIYTHCRAHPVGGGQRSRVLRFHGNRQRRIQGMGDGKCACVDAEHQHHSAHAGSGHAEADLVSVAARQKRFSRRRYSVHFSEKRQSAPAYVQSRPKVSCRMRTASSTYFS
ncbi:MFS transporter [Candidatus Desulfovibrio trichonymphae]|uniref:MFS transporter n=1 Tax=Candidatus Desulfovibrio trichonymphae TaxID=1725232 RepID=UPI0038BC0D89